MPLRFRLESDTIQGNLLLLDSHPHGRPGSNYKTLTIINISKQCPVNLAVQPWTTAVHLELRFLHAGAASTGSVRTFSQNESLMTGWSDRLRVGVRTGIELENKNGEQSHLLLRSHKHRQKEIKTIEILRRHKAEEDLDTKWSLKGRSLEGMGEDGASYCFKFWQFESPNTYVQLE